LGDVVDKRDKKINPTVGVGTIKIPRVLNLRGKLAVPVAARELGGNGYHLEYSYDEGSSGTLGV